MSEIGDRVGAICGTLPDDPTNVRVFGFGVYVGRDVPPADVIGPFGFGPLSHETPKIVLDDGQVVYGCECWWGDEKRVKDELEHWVAQGYRTDMIAVIDYRRQCGARKEKEAEQDE